MDFKLLPIGISGENYRGSHSGLWIGGVYGIIVEESCPEVRE